MIPTPLPDHGHLAVYAPQLNGPSHLWLRRQTCALSPWLSVVVTTPSGGVSIPGVAVEELSALPGPVWRIPPLGRHLRSHQLLRLVSKYGWPKRFLFHWLTSAVYFRRTFPKLSEATFVHCHGLDVTWDWRDDSGRPLHRKNYIAEVLDLAGQVTFIANSRWTRNRLLEIGVPEDRIHLKYFGLEVPSTPPNRSEKAGPISVLFLGRLIDTKGPLQVIDAFNLACSRGLNADLLLAGDGPLRGSCLARAGRSPFRDRIRLVGEVSAQQGEELRRSADIFTSHNQVGSVSRQEEAFGVTNLEAMGSGLPVVGTKSGGVPELVLDGETGILVEPGDIEGHAEALLRLFADSDLRAKMGMEGWRRVSERFSMDREIRAFERILDLPPLT